MSGSSGTRGSLLSHVPFAHLSLALQQLPVCQSDSPEVAYGVMCNTNAICMVCHCSPAPGVWYFLGLW